MGVLTFRANGALVPAPRMSSSLRFAVLVNRFASFCACNSGIACPDRVVTLCLNYLEESIKFKQTYAELKPQLQPLLLGVLFPLLCFSERDQKQWDEVSTARIMSRATHF